MTARRRSWFTPADKGLGYPAALPRCGKSCTAQSLEGLEGKHFDALAEGERKRQKKLHFTAANIEAYSKVLGQTPLHTPDQCSP